MTHRVISDEDLAKKLQELESEIETSRDITRAIGNEILMSFVDSSKTCNFRQNFLDKAADILQRRCGQGP
jgi:hypothetical protein